MSDQLRGGTTIGGFLALHEGMENIFMKGAFNTTNFVSTIADGYRMKSGNYGVIFRNDGSSFYLLVTNSGDQNGTWNALRPFSFNLATGAVNIGNGLAVSGDATVTGNITAYYSDERLKENLGNIDSALDKVLSLNGFYYKNNETAKSLGYTDEDVQVGVSAQEVEKVLPQIVTLAPFDRKENEDGKIVSKSGEDYKTVYYDKLVPLLIEAIKEQQTQIEELKARLDNNGIK